MHQVVEGDPAHFFGHSFSIPSMAMHFLKLPPDKAEGKAVVILTAPRGQRVAEACGLEYWERQHSQNFALAGEVPCWLHNRLLEVWR